MAVLDIVTNALAEINVYAQGEAPSQADAMFSFTKLNVLMDAWSAIRPFASSLSFLQFLFTPNLAPHTIGPSGTFVMAQRPTRLEGAMVILNNVNPPVNTPITIRDAEWWKNQPLPGQLSSFPTDVYYDPTFPNGTLNFWPVAQTAWGVLLETWGLIAQFASLNSIFSMPPGYQMAIELTLAEYLAKPFGATADADLIRRAAKARAAVLSLNTQPPRIETMDSGMPRPQRNRTTFNYRSRSSS